MKYLVFSLEQSTEMIMFKTFQYYSFVSLESLMQAFHVTTTFLFSLLCAVPHYNDFNALKTLGKKKKETHKKKKDSRDQ